jgi:SMC interacting uncharacterized protein involved in chromosome segregation
MIYWKYKHKGVDVMAMSNEDKQEFKEFIATILEELKALKHVQTETNTEVKALKQGQDRLEKKMDEDRKEYKRGQAKLEKKMDSELNALKQGQDRLEKKMDSELNALKQGQDRLEKKLDEDRKEFKRGQARLEKKMDEGFKFLETCINEAAVDIGKTSKRLREHIELPIH